MIFEKGDRILFAGDSVTDMGSNQPIGELNGLGNTTYVNMMHCFSTSSYPELELRLSNAGHSGATTLWEYWPHCKHVDSKNHHMYSDFMSWMIKTIIGIKAQEEHPGYETVNIEPYFFEDLEFAYGACETVRGRISVNWKREKDYIGIEIDIPFAVDAYYQGKKLKSGINKFRQTI